MESRTSEKGTCHLFQTSLSFSIVRIKLPTYGAPVFAKSSPLLLPTLNISLALLASHASSTKPQHQHLHDFYSNNHMMARALLIHDTVCTSSLGNRSINSQNPHQLMIQCAHSTSRTDQSMARTLLIHDTVCTSNLENISINS